MGCFKASAVFLNQTFVPDSTSDSLYLLYNPHNRFDYNFCCRIEECYKWFTIFSSTACCHTNYDGE